MARPQVRLNQWLPSHKTSWARNYACPSRYSILSPGWYIYQKRRRLLQVQGLCPSLRYQSLAIWPWSRPWCHYQCCHRLRHRHSYRGKFAEHIWRPLFPSQCLCFLQDNSLDVIFKFASISPQDILDPEKWLPSNLKPAMLDSLQNHKKLTVKTYTKYQPTLHFPKTRRREIHDLLAHESDLFFSPKSQNLIRQEENKTKM